jgi:transcription antitermination factor NusG
MSISPDFVDFSHVQSDSLRWYVLHVRSRHEKCVAQSLDLKALECFLPTYRDVHYWKNRCRRELDLPLFPGYVFIRVSLAARLHVLDSPGVVRFVGFGGVPSELEDAQVEGLRSGLERCPAEPHPYLHSGDHVLVRQGPFAGMVGILVRKKKDFRVVLTVDLIGKSVAAELDLADLDPSPLHGSCAGVAALQ